MLRRGDYGHFSGVSSALQTWSESSRVDLSIVIVTWNSWECVGTCLDSIGEAMGELATEIIVVDNLSSDSTVAFIREGHPQVKLIQNRGTTGFGRGAQTGVEASGGEFVAILIQTSCCRPGR